MGHWNRIGFWRLSASPLDRRSRKGKSNIERLSVRWNWPAGWTTPDSWQRWTACAGTIPNKPDECCKSVALSARSAQFTWGLLVRASTRPEPPIAYTRATSSGSRSLAMLERSSATTTDGFLRIYDYESGKELQNHSIQQTGQLSATAFDLANQKIATGSSDGSVEIRDFQGKSLCRYSGHNRPIYALAFGVRHSELAFAGEHGAINRLEIASKKSIAVGDHRSTVYALAFLKSEKTLLSAGDDGLIKFWHWDDKAKSYKLGHSGNPDPDRSESVVISPGYCKGADDGDIRWVGAGAGQ